MELTFAVTILVYIPSCILAVDDKDVVYADPMQVLESIRRQDEINNETYHYIYKKLIEHSEKLEKIMTKLNKNEELTGSISDHLNKIIEEPSHGEIEKHSSFSRNIKEKEDIPIVKFGKDIVRYGNLLKTVIMTDITKDSETMIPDVKVDLSSSENDEEPASISKIEDQEFKGNFNQKDTEFENSSIFADGKDDDHQETEGTKRRFDGYEINTGRSGKIDTKNDNHGEKGVDFDNGNSIWCGVAAKCNKTLKPVCGFDDNFGLAKFNDICHMLEINCYWKFNFSIAPC